VSHIIPDPCEAEHQLLDRITRIVSSLSMAPDDALRRVRDLLLDWQSRP
jgi:hypothetical protein